jgi:signal transduction histidine kinase
MTSLKTRLVWILLTLTFVAWVASALLTFFFTSRVMLDQVDRQLEQYSDLVQYITAVFARRVDQGLPISEPWLQGRFEDAHLQPIVIDAPRGEKLNPALNIWLHGSLIAVMADSPRFEKPTVEGFTYGETGNGEQNWRILNRYDEVDELWLQVGIETGGAYRAMLGMLAQAMLPLLLVLPLTVALLYFGVSRGLEPLKALARQIGQRNPALLDPVETADVPEELQVVVASLNQLLQRLALALEGEQRFTAHAAHELLTPLAAIKTEVQLCQLQAGDSRNGTMLERIVQRVDRANHTVSQLLTLARLDPEQAVGRDRVRLDTLLQTMLAETRHLATERQLAVEIDVPQPASVIGSEESLAILICNLLINAFRYATEGSTVNIALLVGELVELEVRNDCPPLNTREFERIGERFYRVPGSGGQGAGLGLSIVAHIAGQHDAQMILGPNESGRGFRVRLRFAKWDDQSGA